MPIPSQEARLIHALSGTPDVLDGLLANIAPGAAQWDRRPDADRFTLREILAHLVDMEEVWTERTRITCLQDDPFLPDWDENRAVIDNDYAHADPHGCLARFRALRVRRLEILESLTDEEWQRPARREFVGPQTLFTQVIYTLLHDCYHTQQVAQWLRAGNAGVPGA